MSPNENHLNKNGSDMNGENSCVLKAVPEHEWPKVRDTYKRDWPYGIYPYYTVENFIGWRKKGFDNKFSIYCLDGRYDDGTTVMISILKHTQNVHVFTYEKSCDRLMKALRESREAIDWNLEVFFYGIHRNHFSHVDGTLKKMGLTTDFEIKSGYYWIPKEKALEYEIECPPDVYVKELSEKDVEFIDKAWPHKYPGSDYYLSVLINMNGGVGLFSKEDDSLRCWILKNHMLGLGVLQTVDEHKRKGYAKLVTKALTQRMAVEGFDIHTCIVRGNEISQNMFKSLGFGDVDDIMFVKYLGCPE